MQNTILNNFTRRSSVFITLVALSIAFVSALSVASDSSTLFESKQNYIFQIKVIDLGSGSKSTIGSGFLHKDSQLIVTNYHVIAEYVQKPGSYRIEVLNRFGNVSDARLITFDVVNDLALLKQELTHNFNVQKDVTEGFDLSMESLSKGDKIYSMGNPLDLGMTIIEGIYNGYVEISRYKKLLISASLNSGMSGGPSVDVNGDVIGINVAKGPEQLSVLVPTQYLRDLIATHEFILPKEEYKNIILNDLLADQRRYFDELFAHEWQSQIFAGFLLPDKIHSSLSCWGHTMNKEGVLLEEVHRHCSSEDEIYINSQLSTGRLQYDYQHYKTSVLNPARFYAYLEKNYTMNFFAELSEEDATNFKCLEKFIAIKNMKWKASSCFRQYKQYPGLYDAGLLLMRVDRNNESILLQLKASGISKEHIRRLHERFLRQITWIN